MKLTKKDWLASRIGTWVALMLSFLFCLPASVFAQVLPYKNAILPISQRVNDLLQRMTPEEKFRQLFMVPGELGKDSALYRFGLFGMQVNTEAVTADGAAQIMEYKPGLNAVQTAEKVNSIQRFFVERTRLGIPVIVFDEALHGLVRTGATAFPQSIALAATWDTALMRSVAESISAECKERGIRQVLSPVVNLATDVRWGRVEETCGEDPVLSAAMGVAYVAPFENSGIITTPKHFVVNSGDGGRDSYPVDVNERVLEESYFVPFKAAIKQGGARSIMTAYNSLNGRPCSANNWLLNEKLKKEWGFTGFVISDAGGVGGANVLHYTASGYEDAGKQAIENGLDVIFQTDIAHAQLFEKPFIEGRVDGARLDSAVARVLRAKFELGLFEYPYVAIPKPYDIALIEAHHGLAKTAALESVVLLKNDDKKILPLSASVNRIALIGPDAVEARLGGYSGPGENKVSLLDALRKSLSKSKTVEYTEGCGRNDEYFKVVPPACLNTTDSGRKIPGLTGEYFNNISLEGKAALRRFDAGINFQWTLFGPDAKINYDFFSCRWTGNISYPETATIRIGIDGNEGYRLYIGDHLLLDTWGRQSFGTHTAPFTFQKGKEYAIRIEYKEAAGNSKFRLVWDAGLTDHTEEKIAAAVQLAQSSDVVIVAAGINEGEFQDRSRLSLPGHQEEMISKIAATGKPVVVVLYGGSAITMSRWLEKVNAVIDAWYPGEAGGEAVADILLGKANPSGRLPITFPMSEGQLPLTYNHKPTGRGDDYSEGSGQPLFPFGYGMSYTTFRYSNCTFSKSTSKASDSVQIKFTLTNTGEFSGDEVVQLFLHDELATVVRPVKELKAFKRVHLNAGESRNVTMYVTPDMFRILNEKMKWVTEPGRFKIMIGGSSKDIRLRGFIEVLPD